MVLLLKRPMKKLTFENTPMFFTSRYFRIAAFFLLLMVGFNINVKSQTKVVGYVPNDQVYVIDYTRITHLNLAFENPDVSGQLSYSIANTTYIEKAHQNGVKVLVSIAGGGASENAVMQNRYFNLIKDENRNSFVQKLVGYVNDHNFDGIDVDLEGSAINADYGKFIAALSTALAPHSKLLTSALSHVNGGANVPDDAIPLFDFINIMAYDATGPWRPNEPGQHSSFAFAKQGLDYWVGRGLAKEKAVLGVPFYGYGFGADFNVGISYANIVKKYSDAESVDVVGNTIYYNGKTTIEKKTQYVVDNKYGGIMIWQLAQDATGPYSLLKAIHNVIYGTVTATEPSIETALELYPNPVDSILNLKVLGFNHTRCNITDVSGNECFVSTKTSDMINVSMFPPGMYIVRLSDDRGKLLIKKFIKL